MKKLFTPLLMLAALLSSTQAWAYTIQINGTSVNTSASSVQTITGTGISGTVQYNPSSKTLTLANATISSTSGDAIYVAGYTENDYLTISFSGTNKITTSAGGSTSAPLYIRENCRVYLAGYADTRGAYVTLENTGGGNALRAEPGVRVDFNTLHFTAKTAKTHCLYGFSSSNILAPAFSWLNLTAPEGYAACTGFTGLYTSIGGLSQCVVSSRDYSFNSSKGGFVNSSGNLVKEAKMEPPLVICGVPKTTGSDWSLTTSSAQASAMGLTAGTISWTNSTKTLTLNDVTLTNDYYALIRHLVTTGITVNLEGTNTLTSSRTIGIDAYRPLTISGSGRLYVTCGTGLYMNWQWECPITINVNNTVKFTGNTGSGVYSISSAKSDLILKKVGTSSDYFFTGGTASDGTFSEPISGVHNLVLDGMDFYTTGCYWDESSHNVKKTGGEVLKNTTVNFYRFTEEYNLYVAGKKLNNINARGLGSPYLTAGTVKYDNSTKTLTLDGATIAGQPSEAATANCAIYSQIPDLTINATGTNNWTTGFICLNLGGGGTNTIKGSGALNITSNDNAAINVWNTTNLTLARTSGKTALKGKYGFSGTGGAALAINKDGSNGGYYTFNGANGHIVSTPTLNLGTGVRIATSYHWFNPEEKAVYYKNDLASASGNTLWIRGDVTWTDYPISIAGSQLYGETGTGSGNIYGFWNKYVKGGAITYNPSTNTLTLNGATIESVGSHGIEMKLEGNIKLVGTNSLSAKTTNNSRYSAICANKFNITITGDGSLNATSDKNCGIHAHEGIVTITDNVKIDATGDCGGLGSILSDYAGTFIISGNAQVKANKITNVATLTLEDGQTIVEPFKAAFNSSNKRVEVNGAVAQNVVIQKVEKYDLAVCDVDVNSYNKDDILRDGGAFKYDPNMKRLTITNANVDDTSVEEGIWNKGIEGLNIAIEGENQINVNEDIFRLKKSTTFSGNGSVKGELTSSSGFGIYLAAANVIGNLNGPKFEFTGRRGVGDNGNSNTNLIIEKGCMVFNPNSSSASILNIQNLTLGSGMIIAKPQGGTFDSSKKGIVVNGSLYNGHAVISQKGDVNVDGTVTIADAVAVLNAMAGQEVAGNPDVNGDKEVSIADFVAVLNIMAGQ